MISENESNRSLEKTIECMANSDVCSDPYHYHSFVSVSFILLPFYKICLGCDERLEVDVFGTSRPSVRCMACGVYAHRCCAFSKHIKFDKCSVNYTNNKELRELSTVKDDTSDDMSHLSLPSEDGKDSISRPAIEPLDSHELPISEISPSPSASFINELLVASKSDNVESDGPVTRKVPLHFASHGFNVVSQALQENIIVSFNRLMPKENDNRSIHSDDDRASSSDENNSTSIATCSKNSGKLFEPSEPHTVIRKHIPLFTVAGSIVGGFVGVVCAGPVGGVIGAAGIVAGSHLQERIDEARVIELGEGTQQLVLLIRPSIKIPEQIWFDIYQQAKQRYPGNFGSGLVQRLIPNETNAARRERYEREVDIVETGEDEIPFADKVLLLASRILNNKDSLPNHVYRELIDAFRCRALNVQYDEDQNHLNRQQRRQDSHAVIKYVTAALLETKAGFGSSSSIIHLAAIVESLVFSEIYGLVMEEIEMEYENQDNELLEKVANFERKKCQDEYSGYKSCISEAALKALHCIPQAHSAVDKLRYCVAFLEKISEHFSNNTETRSAMGADSLLKMVCQHIVVANVFRINSQIAFLEEFACNEELLRGREGYSLVTLKASIHFLNSSTDFTEIFCHDEV